MTCVIQLVWTIGSIQINLLMIHHIITRSKIWSIWKVSMQWNKLEFKTFIDKIVESRPYKGIIYITIILEPQSNSNTDPLSSSNTWTMREITWLNSNYPLIFAAESKFLVNKWVCIINWICEHTINRSNS